jgi:hypothetical protein
VAPETVSVDEETASAMTGDGSSALGDVMRVVSGNARPLRQAVDEHPSDLRAIGDERRYRTNDAIATGAEAAA